MFRIFWTNFGHFSQEEFGTLEAAKSYVKDKFFEAGIWQGETLVASWTVFGGWRIR